MESDCFILSSGDDVHGVMEPVHMSYVTAAFAELAHNIMINILYMLSSGSC